MKDLTPEERELLGLANDERLEYRGEASPPSSGVAEALGGAPLPLETIVTERIDHRPHFEPVLPELRGLETFARWSGDPGVYRLPAGAVLVYGAGKTRDDVMLVDARSDPAIVRIESVDDELVVRLRSATADVFALVRPSRRPPLELVEAPTLPEVPEPSIELLAGAELEPWLAAACADRATADDAGTRVAAVGLLARGWAPVGAAARAAELARLGSGGLGVVDRARAWVSALGPERLEALERSAVDEVSALLDRADALRPGFVQGRAVAEAIAVGLVASRDDLESILAALRLAGAGAHLREALTGVDRALVTHMTELGECEAAIRRALGAHLEGVARFEPDAWWASLAL